jgi:uncharacterized cupredoxin-like copper-binding protein
MGDCSTSLHGFTMETPESKGSQAASRIPAEREPMAGFMTNHRTIGATALAVLLVAALSACSSSEDTTTTTAPAASGTTITVSLGDTADAMFLTPSPMEAPAGDVTFEVTNDGDREHEFVVLSTDFAADDLPFDEEADEALEETDGVVPIDEIESLMPGETKTLTVTLDAGHYALICNIERHYRLGMRSDFTVTES